MGKTVRNSLEVEVPVGVTREIYLISYRYALESAFEARLLFAEEAMLTEDTPCGYTLEIEAVTDWDHAQAAAHWREWLVEAKAEIRARAKRARADAAWWEEWITEAEARAQGERHEGGSGGRKGRRRTELPRGIDMAAAVLGCGPAIEADAIGLAPPAAATRQTTVGGGEITV